MSVSLAKLGATLGLAAGLTFLPVLERVQIQRPSLLYAMAYFQAVLGNTDSAIRIAQGAAQSENGDAPRQLASRQCPPRSLY